jgi:hypothetical protein
MNTNFIPGTDNNPLYPNGPYYPSPDVLNGFEQFKADQANRKEELEKEREDEALNEVFESMITPKSKTVPNKQPKVNDKKVAAQFIFDANKDKSNGFIARLIEKELEITYANAYYYVTRVFKRK